MTEKVTVLYEATPNPQTMKFVITKLIAGEGFQFSDPLKAGRSPLASKIFGFPWAAGVYIGPNFVTVTKQDWVEWSVLADPLANLIQEHIESGQPVLVDVSEDELPDGEDELDDSPIVREIKKILNAEIRPAVAMDGGDVVFHKYENHVLHLVMQGSCAGCPSSTMTLKMGIESRLKEAIPEIKEVVSIN